MPQRTIGRRPARTQPASYMLSPDQIIENKEFNQDALYWQTSRVAVAASTTTPVTFNLLAAGRWLKGITVIPITAVFTTLGDTQVSMLINNNNILSGVPANNLNPNFVQGRIYFPTPQKLTGNDNFQFNILKNDAGATTVYITVFYIPQKI